MLGKLIAGARDELGWTQRDLADRAKPCDPQNISKIERGEHHPRIDTVQRLLRALGISVVLSGNGVALCPETESAKRIRRKGAA